MSAALDVDVAGASPRFPIRARLRSSGPLALIGPNGAGKSTLLMMILGVRRPARGRVALGDQLLFDSEAGVDVPTELRGIGYLPQDYGLFPHLCVEENVAFGLAARGIRGGERRSRTAAALERLEISHLRARRPAALSGGERQRVALARALATEPKALLLDEPLAALDAGARRAVRELLSGHLRELGVPCVVVTHDLSDAAALGARVAVIEAGQIVQEGAVAALRERPVTPFVAQIAGRG